MWKYRLLVVIFFFSIVSCGSDSQKEESENNVNFDVSKSAPTEIDVYLVKKDFFQKEIHSQGKLVSGKKADLSFSNSGIIDFVNVKNGSIVNAGTIISALIKTEAVFAQKESKLQFQKSKLERESMLAEYSVRYPDSNLIPAQIKNNIDIESGYLQSVLDLERKTNLLSECELYSPFTGLIANLKYKKYDKINAGEVFCTLIDNSQFSVEFQILEYELNDISQGDRIKLMPVAMNDTVWAHISEINPIVEKNGLVNIKADIITNKLTEKLFPGMNVDVIIPIQRKDILQVPHSAIVIHSGKEIVFTCKNGQAKWNYVKTAGDNSGYTGISEGINAGDTVIIENNINLINDAPVKIKKK